MIPKLQTIFIYFCLTLLGINSAFTQNDPNFVHPGDVNNNGVVNGVDVLWWGASHSIAGDDRDSLGLIWFPYEAQNISPSSWDSFPILLDDLHEIRRYHADCNGDGFIDDMDAEAFTLNHDKNHGVLIEDTYTEGIFNQNPLLDFDYSGDISFSGDSISIPIVLGSMDFPIEAFHGITFTINFNENFVGSSSFTYVNGWIGENETEVKVIETNDILNSNKNITITRKNLTNVSGYGIIGYLDVVIEGDVPNKQGDTEIASFSKVKLISNTLEEELVVSDVLSINLKSISERLLTIYPNPPEDNYLFIKGVENFSKVELELYDIVGRSYPLISQWNGEIELPELNNGIYFIRIKAAPGFYRKTFKLIISK